MVVPVYGDAAATGACLESLLASERTRPIRVIVVDDASPDPGVRARVAAVGRDPRVTVLRNAVNLGFVGTVNRALRRVADATGDVVLLNADTVVPPGFVDALAAAAVSEPGVGTLTPLSNNGEYTSFPRPFVENPLPTRQEIDRLAGEAAAVGGPLVDLPSGVGFCLYIARACLDAVGLLSEAVERGYLEDLDFCMRARALGFRNVCAPGVFVGHAGSRSFGLEKPALVARNLAWIERRHPAHLAEDARFRRGDPLRAARAGLEARVIARHRFPVVLAGGSATDPDLVARRAAAHGGPGGVLMVRVGHDRAGQPVLGLAAVEGGLPQSLDLPCASAADRAAARALLGRIGVRQVEVVDPAGLTDEAAAVLLAGPWAYDLLIADAGLVCPRRELMGPGGTRCRAVADRGGLARAGSARAGSARAGPAWTRLDRAGGPSCDHAPGCPDPEGHARAWRGRANRARAVTALGPLAAGFVDWLGLGLAPRVTAVPGPPHRGPGLDFRAGGSLGVVGLDRSAGELAALVALGRALRRRSTPLRLVVLGASADDRQLLATGAAWVTGPVRPDELAGLLPLYGVRAVLGPGCRARFDRPALAAARAAGYPTARFAQAWEAAPGKSASAGGGAGSDPGSNRGCVHSQDLVLPHDRDDETVSRILVGWFEALGRPGAASGLPHESATVDHG